MLDLFGGTGNQSFEAISRGCPDVTYVDKFRPAVRFVKKTAVEFDVADQINVVSMDVKRFIKINNKAWDYIFAGPPYPLPWLDQIPDLVFDHKLLADNGLFVLEHNPKHNFEAHPNFESIRSYGQTKFSFFKHKLDETT
jgi:16S rRNA G966 N2-methylase RsmD